jgi:hypothetical protein
VVESYFCPSCPEGAECKPCAIPSAIFVAASPDHAPFGPEDNPADVIAIATDDPRTFETGVEYRFEIAVTGRKRRPVRRPVAASQRPDREPIWTDSPPAN